MRDKWYFHLAVGWYKLSIQERGFVSTLYTAGEELEAAFEDADTIFGVGWKSVADSLAKKKVISVETISLGLFRFKLLLKNANRREYIKKYSQSKTSTEGTSK